VSHALDLYISIIKRERESGDLRGSVIISLISMKNLFFFGLCLMPLVFLLNIRFFDLLISVRYGVVCSSSKWLVLSSFSLHSFLGVILFRSVLICFAAPACLH
jgi:hypothetical protein